ncbi:MAG: PAQR family membrane homeostasis protein TrhA [Methylococcales bacterium]
MMETYPIPGFADPVSSLSHLLGIAVFSVPGYILLRRSRSSVPRLFTLGTFVFSCVFLLSMSTVYHLLAPGGASHRILQLLDHAAIFVLIAGSFTPVHGILFAGWARWGTLLVIWLLAFAGITLKIIFFDSIPEWLGLISYLGLGWMGLASGIAIWRRYGAILTKPLVYSGLSYTFGGLLEFFRMPVVIFGVIGPHELLHFGVLAGIGFHFRFLFGILNRLSLESLDLDSFRFLPRAPMDG